MHWPTIIFCTIVALAMVALEILRRRRLSPMLRRRCAGREWRSAFPEVPRDEIRAFLKLFVNAFALPPSRYLAFPPTDRILDVYRAIHPPRRTLADDRQLETFARDLRRQFGLSLQSIRREDLTLGEVFALAIAKQ